jgi:hypothetical protein
VVLASAGGNSVPVGGLGYLPNGQLVVTATDGTWRPVTLSGPNANGLYQITIGSPISGVDAPADSFANFPAGLSGDVPGANKGHRDGETFVEQHAETLEKGPFCESPSH